MSMFISGEIIVTEQGVIDVKDMTPDTNAIRILPKMSYGVRQRVIGAAAKLIPTKAGNRKERRAARKARGGQDVDFDVGAYQIALLVHNIVGWQGPAFAGVACTPANIERLDPDEPLVAKVIQEIGERNVQEEPEDDDDDPNVIEVMPTTRSLTTLNVSD